MLIHILNQILPKRILPELNYALKTRTQILSMSACLPKNIFLNYFYCKNRIELYFYSYILNLLHWKRQFDTL